MKSARERRKEILAYAPAAAMTKLVGEGERGQNSGVAGGQETNMAYGRTDLKRPEFADAATSDLSNF